MYSCGSYFGEDIASVTLDDLSERALANDNPRLFLESHPWPVIIDEIQKGTTLLEQIKIKIDDEKKNCLKENRNVPLMYILTGSNQFELQKLISNLNLGSEINYDWLIYLIAKTGLRFSEALAVTPDDFDFPHQTLNVGKTWNYKENGGFEPTKNKSSERKIQLDWQTVIQFSELIKSIDDEKPIFIDNKIYNSTINDILARHCKNVGIPIISVHGLRHTHASLLLYAGVSVASVAHRLGHASMTTTQKTYLHIIQELENTDIDKIMRALTTLNN